MNIHDLQQGKYYVSKYRNEYHNIFYCKAKLQAKYLINLIKNTYTITREDATFRTDIQWDVRYATQEEINHLELCNKAGKYIEKPKLSYEIY